MNFLELPHSLNQGKFQETFMMHKKARARVLVMQCIGTDVNTSIMEFELRVIKQKAGVSQTVNPNGSVIIQNGYLKATIRRN